MRLDFVSHQIFLVKGNRAGIIGKYRNTKIPWPVRDFASNGLFRLFPSYLLCRSFDVSTINPLFHLVQWVCEDCVLAVLGPRLRQRFQFHICRISAKFSEMSANCFHCAKIKRKRSSRSTHWILNSLLSYLFKFCIINTQVNLACARSSFPERNSFGNYWMTMLLRVRFA